MEAQTTSNNYEQGIINSNTSLTIDEFLKQHNFSLIINDCFKLLWPAIAEDKPIILNTNLLKYLNLGYTNELISYEKIKEYQDRIIRILINNNINYQMQSFKDIKFYSREDINLPKFESLKDHKWIIMTKNDFKNLLINFQTYFSSYVKDYFIELENIHIMYLRWFIDNTVKSCLDTNEEMIKYVKRQRLDLSSLNQKYEKCKTYLIQSQPLLKTSYISIITSINSHKKSLYKLVGVDSSITTSQLLYDINKSIHERDDRFYFIAHFSSYNHFLIIKMIDFIIKNHITLYKNHQMIRFNLSDLCALIEKIINNFSDIANYFNINRERYVDNIFSFEREVSQTVSNYFLSTSTSTSTSTPTSTHSNEQASILPTVKNDTRKRKYVKRNKVSVNQVDQVDQVDDINPVQLYQEDVAAADSPDNIELVEAVLNEDPIIIT